MAVAIVVVIINIFVGKPFSFMSVLRRLSHDLAAAPLCVAVVLIKREALAARVDSSLATLLQPLTHRAELAE